MIKQNSTALQFVVYQTSEDINYEKRDFDTFCLVTQVLQQWHNVTLISSIYYTKCADLQIREVLRIIQRFVSAFVGH